MNVGQQIAEAIETGCCHFDRYKNQPGACGYCESAADIARQTFMADRDAGQVRLTGWPNPDNWPSNDEFVAATKAVPEGFPLCDCGVPEGGSDASNPDDRAERLPHHFDCSAVSAWVAVTEFLAARQSDPDPTERVVLRRIQPDPKACSACGVELSADGGCWWCDDGPEPTTTGEWTEVGE